MVPKFISPADPVARWTGAHGGQAFFAYSTNYLIDIDNAIIVDVEATTAIRQAEVVGCVSDPVVRSFWVNEYAGYTDSFRSEAVAPIQNKIGKALMMPSLRNMLAQPTATGLAPQITICGRGSTGSMKMSIVPSLGHMFFTKRTPARSSPAATP